MIMTARHLASRSRTANVVRQQVVRPEYRQVLGTSRPLESDRQLPELLRELLKKLDRAEKEK
jgi:hypothetical protein